MYPMFYNTLFIFKNIILILSHVSISYIFFISLAVFFLINEVQTILYKLDELY